MKVQTQKRMKLFSVVRNLFWRYYNRIHWNVFYNKLTKVDNCDMFGQVNAIYEYRDL